MNDSSYAMVGKMLTQGITVIAHHGIDMHHVVGIAEWYGADSFHSDVLIIIPCYDLSSCIVIIKVSELYCEHGSLYLVHAAVEPLIIKYIFSGRAIVGNSPYNFCKLAVVCSHGTCIAKCPKVLARIETMGCGIAQRACTPSLEHAAMGLCIILKEQ